MSEDKKRLQFGIPMDEPKEHEVFDSKETSLFSSITESTDITGEPSTTEAVDAADGIDSGESEGADCDCDDGCDSDCDDGCDGDCDGGCGM